MQYVGLRRRLIYGEVKAFESLSWCPRQMHNMYNVAFTDLVALELAVLEPELRLVSS